METMNQHLALIEHQDHWILPLHGMSVTRCCLDQAFGIELWEQESQITIRIEGAFSLRILDQEYNLSPEHLAEIGPAFWILHKTIDSALAYKDGKLVLGFSDGSRLSVEADPQYEAWEAVGTGGLRVICVPGGSLSIWQPR